MELRLVVWLGEILMKQYDISVRVDGYEYYSVTAETEDEAFQKIRDGDFAPVNSDVGWVDSFYVLRVEEL